MLELIETADRELFLFCNQFHSDTWDTLMWHISGKLEWLPLYLFLLYLVILKFKSESWKILLGVVLVIVLADQLSVKLFKEVVQRYRPCYNLELEGLVHLVNNKCGGKFGFVSSHAANTFALASFVGLTLKRYFSKSLLWLLLWAAVVSYSRIYLGVHYPLDIIGGALLGGAIGCTIYYFINKKLNLMES